MCVCDCVHNRPIGRRGSRGFTQAALLASKRLYIYCFLTVHFKWSTSGLAATDNYRFPSKSDCSYA